MGNPVDSKQGGVQDADGASATSKISSNQTVKTASGFIGLMTDTPQFSGSTITGVWIMGASRVRISGIPIIHTTSVGVGISSAMPPPTTGPLQLGQSDSNVKAL